MSPRRTGGATRRERRERRTAEHWQARLEWAGDDPAARASVHWDQVRAAVRQIPSARRQTSTWRDITDALVDLATGIDSDTQPTWPSRDQSQRAAHAWDLVRRAVARLRPADRRTAWQTVTDALAAIPIPK